MIAFQLTLRRLVHTAAESPLVIMIPLTTPVRQTAVVPCNRNSSTKLVQLPALPCPGSGVVHMNICAVYPPLKNFRILPNIVGQPGQPSLLLCAKGRSELGAPLCCPGQVIQNGLFSVILRNVSEIFHCLPPLIFTIKMAYPHANSVSSRWHMQFSFAYSINFVLLLLHNALVKIIS